MQKVIANKMMLFKDLKIYLLSSKWSRNYMKLHEFLQIRLFIISTNLISLQHHHVNKSRIYIAFLIIFINSVIILRNFVVLISNNDFCRNLIGDSFSVLGNEGKTITLLVFGYGFCDIICRISVIRGELDNSLNSYHDFAPFTACTHYHDAFDKLKLDHIYGLTLKRTIKLSVISNYLTILTMIISEFLLCYSILFLWLLSNYALSTALVIVNMVLWSFIIFAYMAEITGSCFSALFSWYIAITYLKLQIKQINHNLYIHASQMNVSNAEFFRLIKELRLLIVKIDIYNNRIGKQMGFNLCVICTFMTGCLVFICMNIEFKVFFIKLCIIVIAIEICVTVYILLAAAARIHSETRASHTLLHRLSIKHSLRLPTRIRLKINDLLETLGSKSRPIGFYCLDWFPITPKTFGDVSSHVAMGYL